MNAKERLAERFEASRGRLRALAYRMLGSSGEAEDVVQTSWLRLVRAAETPRNLEGWLTRTTARLCLDALRSRRSRRGEPLDAHPTEPVEAEGSFSNPEQELLQSEAVGLALLVMLERLSPGERVAFVLHDTLKLPFEEIASILGRSSAAARQLASRARRRMQGAPQASDHDLAPQREAVGAFLTALRAGDIDGLLAVLDPQVLRIADAAAAEERARELRGSAEVAGEALRHAGFARFARPMLINGSVGIAVAPLGRLRVAISCAIDAGKIIRMEVIRDPKHLRKLSLAMLPANS
ncbi:sigma-70 family RNA polymerase sigma factor [Verrucomicrobium sp. 3C]|uniref:sigma-70 family RNA polymerase sigma factor n=1 Tax=Verrucomicrobium sp. 3C TaxID=1134055 RepID=UPI00047658B1|nr:sigma-70 family RNA polymerase sigma factor [Verrucomicrobium sp. 3C]